MRKVGTDNVIEYKIKGTDSKVIDMPVYYTHNLKKYRRYRINLLLLDERHIKRTKS